MSFKMVFKASKSDLPIQRYINLSIRNYVQTLVEWLPLFACTEKNVLPRSGPFSQVLPQMFSRSLDAERCRGRRGLLSDEERKKPQ